MPSANNVPSAQLRTHITIANALWVCTLPLATLALATLYPVAGLAFGALMLAQIASDMLARRYSPHVVYILRDENGEAIYVGQTDDVMRRMYQHTDGVEHSWWRDIHGYNIWRHCWNDRHARRVERRLIGVVNRCSTKAWCSRLRNEQFGEDHKRASRKLSILAWVPVYLLSNWMADSRTFTSPVAFSRSIPARPSSTPDDDYSDTFDGFDEQPDQSDSGWEEATYERPSTERQRMGLEPLALPPVSGHTDDPVTARHSRSDPFRGLASDTPSQAPRCDTRQAGATGATIRDAHRRQQAATLTQLPDDLAALLTPEEAEALDAMGADDLKTLHARLRKRKSRAGQTAAADRSPTYTARTRKAQGGGAGGGEG